MDSNPSLPHLEAPHDTMRFGLSHLRDSVLSPHPAATAFLQTADLHQRMRHTALENAYGSAFPASLSIEKQMLSKHKRLPGLPTSHVSLQAMTGDLDMITAKDILGYGDLEVAPSLSLHEQMEKRMGITPPPQF